MDLEKLRAVADAAGTMPSDPNKLGIKVVPDDSAIVEGFIRERHARFYATFNPETVLALLGIADAAREVLAASVGNEYSCTVPTAPLKALHAALVAIK